MVLEGNEQLKSLGAIYSMERPPEARFDDLFEKIKARMMRWQSRHPSRHARVLVANSLLSSCLWFFAYFIIPTAAQLVKFDQVVWGMVWGKERGALGSRGQVNKLRMAGEVTEGGLKVIIPSIMIKAIRINMVNRALMDRGRWWSSIFHFWCEKAGGGLFRAADGLLQHPLYLKRLVGKLPSKFWAQAVKDWMQVGYGHPLQDGVAGGGAHREMVGANPVLASYLAAIGRVPRRVQQAAATLCRADILYLSDLWDFTRLEWCSDEMVELLTEEARMSMGCPLQSVLEVVASVKQHAADNYPAAVQALQQNRETNQDQPKQGEVWADMTTSPLVLGVVTEVDASASGPVQHGGEDRDDCPCTEVGGSQGDCVWMVPVQHQEGFGRLPHDLEHHAQQPAVPSCSCSLSPVTVIQDRMYGVLATTGLTPPWLGTVPTEREAKSLTLFSPIKDIRAFLRRMEARKQRQPDRPPAEFKWCRDLGIIHFGVMDLEDARKLSSVEELREAARTHLAGGIPVEIKQILGVSTNEWRERWRILSTARVAGPTRSFMWRLMHRVLPLLNQPWLAAFYQRPPHCLLCPHRVVESYTHLFSTCSFAEGVWAAVAPVLNCLRFPPPGSFDPTPARLVGDLSHLDMKWLQDLPWGGGERGPPSEDKLLLYYRTIWTEVRSTVLKAIWDVRCAVLKGGMTTREEARSHAHQQIRTTLSSLIYSKMPTALGGGFISPSDREQIFYRATWGQLVSALVSRSRKAESSV